MAIHQSHILKTSGDGSGSGNRAESSATNLTQLLNADFGCLTLIY